jgi:hypothetical protein
MAGLDPAISCHNVLYRLSRLIAGSSPAKTMMRM